ncbi:MAG: rhodanese-like domain-containing protein [Pseudomonadota bacterium]
MTITAAAVDQLTPGEAYSLMVEHPAARMVDVRTLAEWTYVGFPDLGPLDRSLWRIELFSFPGNRPNHDFVAQLGQQMAADGGVPDQLLFICRSGARSMTAAMMVAEEARTGSLPGGGSPSRLINVAEGFEGDLDPRGHRGSVNGWKVHGLPWRQN